MDTNLLPSVQYKCIILTARRLKIYSNMILQVQTENEYSQGIVTFYKVESVAITEENVHEVIQATYFKGKPVMGLYHVMQNIFTPMILQVLKFKIFLEYSFLIFPFIEQIYYN